MTTNLEKQFFNTFEIEPDVESCYHKCDTKSYLNCKDCNKATVIYPQITDHILLELICIANDAYIDLKGTNIETMKNNLLENFIFFRRDVKQQVQALFKE